MLFVDKKRLHVDFALQLSLRRHSFTLKLDKSTMKAKIVGIAMVLISTTIGKAQEKTDSIWTLQQCIEQAMQQNIQIQQSALGNDVKKLTVEQSKASRFPNLNATASQNFNWSKELNATAQYGSYQSGSGSNYGLNSSVTLFNGFRINNTIKQSSLDYEAGTYNTENLKEEIRLNVLDLYLQVLYSQEQVNNAQRQVETTSEQLRYAEERQTIGIISKADLLQVKSQLASEKSTLATAQKALALNKVSLLQLMELPVSTNLILQSPNIESIINSKYNASSDSIYAKSLEIKPQIKNAELSVKSAEVGVKIAKASYLPSLQLSGGISTAYTKDFNNFNYNYQVQNRLVPSIGLTLSIPIFENKQIKTSVAKSRIVAQTAALSERNTRNELRKAIEQACVEATTAEQAYYAGVEEYNAAQESFLVSTEKFNNGMLNPIDFLIQKTNLIAAESRLLQSKYNLIFSYKTIDFYMGIPFSL